MAEAFMCDACDTLEAGKPAQRVTVKPVMGASEDLDLCSSCLVSHNDWRVSRAPEHDRPDADDLPTQDQYA